MPALPSPSFNSVVVGAMLSATQCDTPAPYWPSTSDIRMAKLLVLAGALCQASSGETFLPGQGQMAGLRGEQARFWSSPPKRTAMRAPSLIQVGVRVIQEAASAAGTARIAAARPIAPVLI